MKKKCGKYNWKHGIIFFVNRYISPQSKRVKMKKMGGGGKKTGITVYKNYINAYIYISLNSEIGYRGCTIN